MLDWVIRNALIVDGTGSAGYRADVGIRGDRIASIGPVEGLARWQLDATGLVLAPGFVDVHTHSDGPLLRQRHFVAKTSQGFTTEVLMLDGIGYAPLVPDEACQWFFYLRALDGLRLDEYRGWSAWSEFMQRLDHTTAQNTLGLVPYANIRTLACGFGPGVPDDFQRLDIAERIGRCMRAGAAGLSTGLDYVAQCHATTEELAEACRAVAPYHGVHVTHVRYKAGLLPALAEAIEIGRRAGVAVHISHLKAVGGQTVAQVLDLLERGRRDVDLTFDVYPYQSSSTMLNYLLPYEVWHAGPLAALDRLRSPEIRRRFAAGLAQYRLSLERLRIAWLPSAENKHWQGRTLAEFIAVTGREPADALCDLLIEERLAVLLVLEEGEDAAVHPFLTHELAMIGSDGIYFPDGQIHPRVMGTAPRLLGPLVRDARLLTLEQAVHKLTALPARRFGLTGRGVIHCGNYADLVAFDPAAITDRATYDRPQQLSTGVSHVWINGVAVIQDGQPKEFASESPPGRWLRYRATD